MKSHVYIIIPVYNREDYVARSIDSILNQTYQNWSLVLVDDNSTDGTNRILARYARNHSRIDFKLNSEYSHSAAGARLSGLLDLKGEYVAFLDSDDTWPSYHLEELVAYLEKFNNIDVIFGDLQRRDIQGNILTHSKFKDEKGLPECLSITWHGDLGLISNNGLMDCTLKSRFTIGLHSAVFRKHVFDKVLLREIKTGEDFLFTIEMIAQGVRIGVVNKIQMHYLVHDNNISSCNPDATIVKQLENLFRECEIFQTHIPKHLNLTKHQKFIIKKQLADLYVWQIANCVFRKNQEKLMALKYIFKAILLFPYSFRYYKTFFGVLFD